MRITPIPQWLSLTDTQIVVFKILYDCPLHIEKYCDLYEIVVEKLPALSKPNFSDMLKRLEARGLVSRTIPRGSWKVTEATVKMLVEQAKAAKEDE